MNSEPQKRTPDELLAYQAELLEQILASQKQISNTQIKFEEAQIAWLKSIDGQAKQQSGHLHNISIASTILVIWLFLSVLGGLAAILGIL